MTTISSASAAYSPRQHLLDRIASQVQGGTIRGTDQTALDSAVEDIDASLSSDRGSAGSSRSSSTRLDPSQIRSRIDDLIAGEVGKGTLTSAQADTLKSVLSQGGPGKGGPGSPDGAGGPPPGPPPGSPPARGGSADGSSGSDSDSDSSSSAASLLASFIQQLQASQASGGYAANGTTDASRSVSALLLNFEA